MGLSTRALKLDSLDPVTNHRSEFNVASRDLHTARRPHVVNSLNLTHFVVFGSRFPDPHRIRIQGPLWSAPINTQF